MLSQPSGLFGRCSWSLSGRSAPALWKTEGLWNQGELTKGPEKYKTKEQMELSSAVRLMLEGCTLWGGWGLLWGMGNLAHLSGPGKASVLVPGSLFCLLLCLFRKCFLFRGTFFSQTFFQPKCNQWERSHQDKWFYGIREVRSLINLCKTAAASRREMGDLGIKHGDERQSDLHGCCYPGWCACLLCSQPWYSSQLWEK